MSNNPNASVAAVAGAITILLVWIAGLVSLDVPAEASSAFTTLIVAAILFVGNRRPQTVKRVT